jgi:hypothetical protein
MTADAARARRSDDGKRLIGADEIKGITANGPLPRYWDAYRTRRVTSSGVWILLPSLTLLASRLSADREPLFRPQPFNSSYDAMFVAATAGVAIASMLTLHRVRRSVALPGHETAAAVLETSWWNALDLFELPQPRTLRHRILYGVVMFILRFDIPVRVPSPDLEPRGSRPLEELRAQWEANHELLRNWIESSDPFTLARPLFVHPVAGPMTTTEALRMLEVHLDRHVRQIMARGIWAFRP